MPEIRQRDSDDFIKTKGKGKQRGSVGARIDDMVRENTWEYRNKKEDSVIYYNCYKTCSIGGGIYQCRR